MWQSLHDAWWRLATLDRPHSFPDVLACRALQTGAAAYRAAVALRNAAYDRGWVGQVRLPCRVVSVGNLTVGGTGKTACVELIAATLARQGRRVAILSRGYGGRYHDYWLRWEDGRVAVHGASDEDLACSVEHPASRVTRSREAPHPPGADDPPTNCGGRRGRMGWRSGRPREAGKELFDRADLADEPQLLARRLPGVPILVGPRRDRTGRLACGQLAADTVILDDGFQHRHLARDCEIVLVHARMPFGGWAVLPRGPMREPLASLRRADVLIITKADEALETVSALRERLRTFNREAVLVTASHAPTSLVDALTGEPHPLTRLEGARVGLLSSIGDPAGFDATVRRLQATVAWHRQFPDHHRYRSEEWRAVAAAASSSRPDAIVTTEKDWVRLEPVVRRGSAAPIPLWVLGVRMQLLSGEEDLHARLAGLVAR